MADQPPDAQGTAQSRYASMRGDRDVYLQRARDCSAITIPSLIPPEGKTKDFKIVTPYQSAGGIGANNLASKLTLSLLPPGTAFFRFMVDPSVYEEARKMKQNVDQHQTEIEKALAKQEKAINTEIEISGDRVGLYEACRHLVVGGNVLVHDSDKGMRVFPLNQYVCKRDSYGEVQEIVLVESVPFDSLPEEFQKTLRDRIEEEYLRKQIDKPKRPKDLKEIDVYTHLLRVGEKMEIYQEAQGFRIPGSEGDYHIESCPWMALRLIRISGEDYGRSYVEEYLGDLQSLEALSQAIVEGAAMAAKVIIFVDPNGRTRAKVVTKARNGDVVEGHAEDVTILHMDKHADFSVAERMADKIEGRLAKVFLLNTAVQRNAERVTAEEIRYVAQELDVALSGVYSIMSKEFQLPYLRAKMLRMEKTKKLAKLPKDIVRPTVITGVEALGRGQDRNKLVMYIKTLTETLGPEIVAQEVDANEFCKRLAIADGIDTDGLIKSAEQKAQEQQAAQQQAAIHSLGPKAIDVAGKAAMQQMQQQEQPQPQGA